MAIDHEAATELELYINNDGQLYRSQMLPIMKNLRNKMAAGKFNKTLGAKAFLYLVDAGAKKYAKDFGGVWYQMFPPETRRAVAKGMVKDFHEQAKAGEHDDLLFKKYQ